MCEGCGHRAERSCPSSPSLLLHRDLPELMGGQSQDLCAPWPSAGPPAWQRDRDPKSGWGLPAGIQLEVMESSFFKSTANF